MALYRISFGQRFFDHVQGGCYNFVAGFMNTLGMDFEHDKFDANADSVDFFKSAEV